MRCSHKAFAAILLVVTVTAVAAPEPNTRQIMRELYDSIVYLLTYSTRDYDQVTHADRELLSSRLARLVDNADALATHAQSGPESFRLLARSFEQIAGDLDLGFGNEWPDYAYFSLMELAEHCAACHAQMPSGPVEPLGQKLLAWIGTDTITPNDMATLMIATREFETAMSILERELNSTDNHAVQADYSGQLLAYLRLAVASDRDPARPVQVLERFKNRDDVPHYLKHRIAFWIESIDGLRDRLHGSATLDEIMPLVAESDGLTRAPSNRLRAVHDMVATALLQRYLRENRDAPAADRAEAYYQLGVIALRTFEINFSVPALEFLFVAAIEADPGGRRAADAYRLLEEYGYVREHHLADPQPMTTRVIDMLELRRKAGIDTPHDAG